MALNKRMLVLLKWLLLKLMTAEDIRQAAGFFPTTSPYFFAVTE